ncbi:S8 family serine peptidase [Pontibacter oryzae]|uniref:T9SS C-terminal target domain-containing protein n=1 Tax=Pontibacter oryzae TaxID=2304593 RepID=A0A399S347_9BACT|nr:S8 family serine peptidase [Pontibacter oryzae]RIJ37738.1 T9SS C-terminal target domain-containing protein [Pontibacter oryzae]
MKKLLSYISVAIMVMATGGAHAQTTGKSALKANQTELQRMRTVLGEKYSRNKDLALQMAKQRNWAVQQVQEDGTLASLEGIDALGFPVYYITQNNTRAAATISTNQLWAGGSTGLNLSGNSAILSGKLGVWDGGAVRATHQELTGRIVQRDNVTSISDHATHVSGTMIGSGVNALAKGMSFGALNLQAWDFSNDGPEMAAAAAGLLISNHSYGTIAGWRYNSSRAGTTSNPYWEFYGNPNVSTTEDANFGYYNDRAREWDQIAYNAPYYLIVKSAGNNRSENGPAIGQPFWKLDANGYWTLVTARPAGISSNNGYDIISTYGNAKNILTVGAVEPIANGYRAKEDVKISSFSSWGPTDDGRIKPDVVGNGVGLLSSIGTADNTYASYNGTSMSSPNVSGSLNLLQEYYHKLNGNFMRAATLKGLAIHTADEAGASPGPDYVYGWGLVNMERAANLLSNKGNNYQLAEKTLAEGETYTFNVTASGKGPLMITISWTDVEGETLPFTAAMLNNRAPRLVNDLDLRISKGLEEYKPWVLDPANPANPAGFGDNILDNVEQVYIANAVPGASYTVTVSHKGTLTRGPQAYSILASGVGGSAYCASGATSDADSKIDSFSFAGISNTSGTSCSAFADFTNLTGTAEPGQTLPLSIGLGTCGAENNKIAKVFIDWNGNSSFDDAGELVATSGTVSGSATFNTSITVPSSVTPNTQTRMRVVLVETNDAADVKACGTYAKGETQDYLLRFAQASKDVGVASLAFPDQNLCANPSQGIIVLLRNYGTVAQSNIPVTVAITNNNGQTTTLTGTYTSSLPANGEARFYMQGSFNAQAGKTYTFAMHTSLADDQNPANNAKTETRVASNPAAAPTATASICAGTQVALKSAGDGTTFWYDAAIGGNLLAAGNNTSIPAAPAGNVLFAALNDFTGQVGPAAKTSFTGGGYNQYGPSVYVTAKVPFILESARLYIGNPGKITFTVETLAGVPVSTTTLDVTNTRTPAAAGSVADDPTDQGAVYPLNLAFPSAGDYRISIAYENGATIFRNNAGVTGYPFTIPNVMSITGNSATAASYYYFYNVKVKAYGCAGPRVVVPVNTSAPVQATITAEGATTFCEGNSVVLKSNTGTGYTYAWFKGGQAIAGATAATYTATTSAEYTVKVTNELGCDATSAPTTVTVNALPPATVVIEKDFTPGICLGDAFSQTLRAKLSTQNAIYTYQWYKDGAPIAGADQSTYTATAKGSYTLAVATTCGSTVSQPVVLNNDVAQITVENASACANSSATINAQTSSGQLYWYSAATGGELLYTGNSFTTPKLERGTSYFVAASNATGGKLNSPSSTTGGSYSSFTGGRMYFDAAAPFVLEKATINVATAGTMTIGIMDMGKSDVIVNRVTIEVTPGVKEYTLNLVVPNAGTDYGIQVIDFGGGATAYRNNTANAATYPYKLDGLVSITGNNQTAPTSFYYFLYEWQVSTPSCATAARTEVPVTVTTLSAAIVAEGPTEFCEGGSVVLSANTGVSSEEALTNGYTYLWSNGATTPSITASAGGSYTVTLTSKSCQVTSEAIEVIIQPLPAKPTITQNSAELSSSAAEGNQWFLNGVAIEGATGQTHTATASGKYNVQVTSAQGCSNLSADLNLTLTGLRDFSAENGLQVTPNPTNGKFSIKYSTTSAAPVQVRLVSMVGKVVFVETAKNVGATYTRELNLPNLADGMYVLHLQQGNRTVTRKVVVRH